MTPAWDIAIFRAVHHGLHHPALDPVMRALTDPGRWKVPLLAILGLLLLTRGRRGLIALVVLTLTLTASDQLSSTILKPIFKRPRPSVALSDTRPLFGVRRSYSFPSTHATNFFAAAPVISALLPGAAAACYALATLASLSRVYVGDHYPSDVLGGAILGTLIGLVGRKGYRRAVRTWATRPVARGAPAEHISGAPTRAASSGGGPNAGP